MNELPLQPTDEFIRVRDESARARHGVVEQVYYQAPGEEAQAVHTNYSTWQEGDDAPLRRRIKISGQWQQLNLGWVQDPVLIVLANEEGKNLRTQPSEEQIQAIRERVVEVALNHGFSFALVRPGRSLRLEPIPGRPYYVCAGGGGATCTLLVIPR